MKKLISHRGETLVESLCAILVITLVFLFLCGAIVAAARSNAQIKGADQSFRYADMAVSRTKNLVVNGHTYTVKEWVTQSDTDTTGKEYADAIYRRYTTQEATE